MENKELLKLIREESKAYARYIIYSYMLTLKPNDFDGKVIAKKTENEYDVIKLILDKELNKTN